MSIESEYIRKQYQGNGSTLNFAFPYKCYDVTDLDVYLTDPVAKTSTLQPFVTNYDFIGAYNPLTGNNDDYTSGGTVEFVTAPASNFIVVLLRNTPDTQDTSFTENSSYSSAVVELAFDKLVMMIQYLFSVMTRSIRMQDGDTGSFNPQMPLGPIAGTGLVVDPTGSFFQWGSTQGPSSPTANGTQSNPQSVSSSGGISLTNQACANVAWVTGNGGAVTVTSNPSITAGVVIGEVLTVIGMSATNTVTLQDKSQQSSSGLQLNGEWVGGLYSALTLMWDGLYWVEISRR